MVDIGHCFHLCSVLTDRLLAADNRHNLQSSILGDAEVTANLYCNFAYPYWEGFMICSIYLRLFLVYLVYRNDFFEFYCGEKGKN